jgi:hypothetical protein
MTQADDPQNSPTPDRLNGWKDIATCLGKGVRTVQRWEREYGLPVHRIGREGGEIVFALRSELDAWMRANELRARQADQAKPPDPATPPFEDPAAVEPPAPASEIPAQTWSRSRLVPWLAVVILATAVVAVLTWRLGFPQPASWKVEHGVLHIYNGLGRELWNKSFFGSLADDPYGLPSAGRPGGFVTLKDIDGDGSIEVLFAAVAPDRNPEEAFYIFNSDGTPRKIVRPDARRTYGEPGREQLQAGPPWAPYRVFVLDRTVFVVFIHGQEYPTVLLELDAQGNPASEYWSDGYIEALTRQRWRGHDVLFVGGTNNETRGGALAIFESGHAVGFAPSEKPAYRCQNCPSGAPSEFIVFPRRCMARSNDTNATVDNIWVEDELRVHVQVGEGPENGDRWWWAGVLYTLGPELVVTQVEATTGLLDLHDQLQRQGTLDHKFGAQDRQLFFPVQRWVEPKWVDLVAAPGLVVR